MTFDEILAAAIPTLSGDQVAVVRDALPPTATGWMRPRSPIGQGWVRADAGFAARPRLVRHRLPAARRPLVRRGALLHWATQ